MDGSGLVWTDGLDYERFGPCALRAGFNGHVSSLASGEQVHEEAVCDLSSEEVTAKATGIWTWLEIASDEQVCLRLCSDD